MLCGTLIDGYPCSLMIKLKYFTISLGFSVPSERAVEIVTTDCMKILISVSLTWFCNAERAGGLGSRPLVLIGVCVDPGPSHML